MIAIVISAITFYSPSTYICHYMSRKDAAGLLFGHGCHTTSSLWVPLEVLLEDILEPLVPRVDLLIIKEPLALQQALGILHGPRRPKACSLKDID